MPCGHGSKCAFGPTKQLRTAAKMKPHALPQPEGRPRTGEGIGVGEGRKGGQWACVCGGGAGYDEF